MTPTISVVPPSSTSAHETSVTTREPEPSAKRAFQPGADAIEVIFRATRRPYGKPAAAIRLATDAVRTIPRNALVMSSHGILTWGATIDETTARLPGDELLEHPDAVSTRAVTIGAPAAAVWPWLAQMGPSPRGGAYTYDWIDNLLGLDMHSVDRVLPEFRHPEVGDTIGLGANRMQLERVEPGHVLAWRSEDGNWVWTFVLKEHDGTTRLISRNRLDRESV